MSKKKQLEDNIRHHEHKIVELKQELEELEELPPEKELAEQLHSIMCTADHVEMCSWFYESWENPGYSHERYLKKADALLNSTYLTPDEICQVLRIARET